VFSSGVHLSKNGLKDKARELLERATEMNPVYRELSEQILSI
jgi:hypothetical protein